MVRCIGYRTRVLDVRNPVKRIGVQRRVCIIFIIADPAKKLTNTCELSQSHVCT